MTSPRLRVWLWLATVVTLVSAVSPWLELRTANGSVVSVRVGSIPVLGWLAVGAWVGLCVSAIAVAARGPRYLGFCGLASGLYIFGLALVVLNVGASASRLAALLAIDGDRVLTVAASPGIWLALAGSAGVTASFVRWILEPPGLSSRGSEGLSAVAQRSMG